MGNKNKMAAHEASVRIFQNDFLDKLTKTHIAIPVSLFILYAIGLIVYTKYATDLNNLTIVGLFFAGWLVFTFAEYWIHRKVYHLPATTPKRERFVFVMHGAHHHSPKDKQRLAMPPALSILVGTLLLLIFQLILGNYAFATLSGFMIGYAGYLIVHYIVHIFRPPGNIFKALWTNHAIHHYKDDSVMFGVSSPIWDYVYGTTHREDKGKKSVNVSA